MSQVPAFISQWAKNLGSAQLRHLRMLAFSLWLKYKDPIGERNQTQICLRFDPTTGLTADREIAAKQEWDMVGDWYPITPLSYELLVEHLQKVS